MATEISVKKLRFYWGLYGLVLIPLALVLLFNYYPIFNGFIHIFYHWDGDSVEEFTGLKNLIDITTDVKVWKSFGVVLIFVVANLFKMIIPIIAAVVLHHIIHEKANYAYRVMFVIPMVIPAMVGLRCADTWVHECAGIALPDAESRIALPGEKFRCRGELLFTHNGFSAFAILDMAGSVAELLTKNPTVPLRINFTPDVTRNEWENRFSSWRRKSGTKKMVSLLSEYLPRKVAAALVGDSDIIAARLRGKTVELSVCACSN